MAKSNIIRHTNNVCKIYRALYHQYKFIQTAYYMRHFNNHIRSLKREQMLAKCMAIYLFFTNLVNTIFFLHWRCKNMFTD